MAITEECYYEGEFKSNGVIQVKCVTRFFRDGVVIPGSDMNHRSIINPGDPIPTDDPNLHRMVTALHDDATVTRFKKEKEKRIKEENARLAKKQKAKT